MRPSANGPSREHSAIEQPRATNAHPSHRSSPALRRVAPNRAGRERSSSLSPCADGGLALLVFEPRTVTALTSDPPSGRGLGVRAPRGPLAPPPASRGGLGGGRCERPVPSGPR